MDWSLDNDRPIWLQLYEQLVFAIVTGEYGRGTKVPAVRELAAQAGVNPNTMQRALSCLEDHGLVTTNRTAGRVVTEDQDKIEVIRMELAGKQIEAYLQGMGRLGFTEKRARELMQREECM